MVFLSAMGIATLLTISLLYDGGLFFLVLTACLLGLSLYAVWRMISALAGSEESEMETAALRRRRELVNTKDTALRVVQELEFDRDLGRISDADYMALSGPLKKEAMEAIRRVDEEQAGYRSKIEAELARRLRSEGIELPEAAAAGVIHSEPASAAPAEPAKQKKRKPLKARASSCPSCNRGLDADSVFCKFCGHRVGEGNHEA